MDNIEIVLRHRNPDITDAEIQRERERIKARKRLSGAGKAMACKSPSARRKEA